MATITDKIGIINAHLLFDILMNPDIGNDSIIDKLYTLFSSCREIVVNLLKKHFEYGGLIIEDIFGQYMTLLKNNANNYKLLKDNINELLTYENVLLDFGIEQHYIAILIEKNKDIYNVLIMNAGKGINNVEESNKINKTGVISQCIVKILNINKNQMSNIYNEFKNIEKYSLDKLYYVMVKLFANPNDVIDEIENIYVNLIEKLHDNKIITDNKYDINKEIEYFEFQKKIINNIQIKKYDFYIQNIGNCTLIGTLLVLYYLLLKQNNFSENLNDIKMYDRFKNFIFEFNQTTIAPSLKNNIEKMKFNKTYEEITLYNICKILKNKYNTIDKNFFTKTIKNNDCVSFTSNILSSDIDSERPIEENIYIDETIDILKNEEIPKLYGEIFLKKNIQIIQDIILNLNNIPQIYSSNYVILSNKNIKNISDKDINVIFLYKNMNEYVEKIEKILNTNIELTNVGLANLNRLLENSDILTKKINVKVLILKFYGKFDIILSDKKNIDMNDINEYWMFMRNIAILENKKDEYISYLISLMILKILNAIYKYFELKFNINNTNQDINLKKNMILYFDNTNCFNNNRDIINIRDINDNMFIDLEHYDKKNKLNKSDKNYDDILNIYTELYNILNDNIETKKIMNEKIITKNSINIPFGDYLEKIIKSINDKYIKQIIYNFNNKSIVFIFLELINDTNIVNFDYKNFFMLIYKLIYASLFCSGHFGVNENFINLADDHEWSNNEEKINIFNVLNKIKNKNNVFNFYNLIADNITTWKNKKMAIDFELLLLPINSSDHIDNINIFSKKKTLNNSRNINYLDYLVNIEDILNNINDFEIEIFLQLSFCIVYLIKINNNHDENTDNITKKIKNILENRIHNFICDDINDYFNYLYLLYIYEIIDDSKKNYKKIFFFESRVNNFCSHPHEKLYNHENSTLFENNINILKQILLPELFSILPSELVIYTSDFNFLIIQNKICLLKNINNNVYIAYEGDNIEYSIGYNTTYDDNLYMDKISLKKKINSSTLSIIVKNFNKTDILTFNQLANDILNARKINSTNNVVKLPFFLRFYIFYKINDDIENYYDIYVGITYKKNLSNIIIINPSYKKIYAIEKKLNSILKNIKKNVDIILKNNTILKNIGNTHMDVPVNIIRSKINEIDLNDKINEIYKSNIEEINGEIEKFEKISFDLTDKKNNITYSNFKYKIDIKYVHDYSYYIYDINMKNIYVTISQFVNYCNINNKNKIIHFLQKVLYHISNELIQIHKQIYKTDINNIFVLTILDLNKQFNINFETEDIHIDDYNIVNDDDLYIDNNDNIYKWMIGISSILLLKKNQKYILMIMNKIFVDNIYENIVKYNNLFTNLKKNEINIGKISELMNHITLNIYLVNLSDNHEYITGSLDAMITYLLYAYLYGNTYVIKKITSVINAKLYIEKINENSQLILASLKYINFLLYTDKYYLNNMEHILEYLDNMELSSNVKSIIENIFNVKNEDKRQKKNFKNLQSFLCDKIEKKKTNFNIEFVNKKIKIKDNIIVSKLSLIHGTIGFDKLLLVLNNLFDNKLITFEEQVINHYQLTNDIHDIYIKKINYNLTDTILTNIIDKKLNKLVKLPDKLVKLPNMNNLINNTIDLYKKKEYCLNDVFDHSKINIDEIFSKYFITYEYMFDSLIKKFQFEFIDEMYKNINSENMHIKHLMMGQGKSSYIVPLLILKLIELNDYVFIIVPEYLLTQTFNFLLLTKYTYDKLNKYYKMNIITLDNNNYDKIKNINKSNYLYNRKIIITTMYNLKKMILFETCLRNIIKTSPIIIDEADELLDNTKNELNIEDGIISSGFSNSDKILKLIIVEIVNKCMFNISNEWNVSLLKNDLYQQIIFNKDINDKLMTHLRLIFANHIDIINNYENYFSHTLIPALLSNIYNRHFGLDISLFNNFRLAIPYSSEYTPSKNNVYDDIYLTIGLSYICYKLADNNTLNELSKIYLKKIKIQSNKYNTICFNIFNDYIKNIFGKNVNDIDVNAFDIDDFILFKNKIIVTLFDDACEKDITVCKSVKNISTVDIFQSYITTKKIGLTGTPNEIINIDMLDYTIFNNDVNNDIYLDYKKNIKKINKIVNVNLSLKNMCWLEGIINNGKLLYNCIIDLGSFFVNYNIDSILKILCNLLNNVTYNDKLIKYILYPDNNIINVISIYNDCNIDPVIDYKINIDHIFYLIPQRYTVGFDVIMPINTHSLITLNYTLITYDNFMQAIYRMRQINDGQIFSVAIPISYYSYDITLFLVSIFLNKKYNTMDKIPIQTLNYVDKFNISNIIDIVGIGVSLNNLCWMKDIFANKNVCLIDLSNFIHDNIDNLNNYLNKNLNNHYCFINNYVQIILPTIDDSLSPIDIKSKNNLCIFLFNDVINNIKQLSDFINQLDNKFEIFITVSNLYINIDNINNIKTSSYNIFDLLSNLNNLIKKKYTIITTVDIKKIKKKNLSDNLLMNSATKKKMLESSYAIQLANAYLRKKKHDNYIIKQYNI